MMTLPLMWESSDHDDDALSDGGTSVNEISVSASNRMHCVTPENKNKSVKIP